MKFDKNPFHNAQRNDFEKYMKQAHLNARRGKRQGDGGYSQTLNQ